MFPRRREKASQRGEREFKRSASSYLCDTSYTRITHNSSCWTEREAEWTHRWCPFASPPLGERQKGAKLLRVELVRLGCARARKQGYSRSLVGERALRALLLLFIKAVETSGDYCRSVDTWRKVLDFLITVYPGTIEELVAKVVRLSQSGGCSGKLL